LCLHKKLFESNARPLLWNLPLSDLLFFQFLGRRKKKKRGPEGAPWSPRTPKAFE